MSPAGVRPANALLGTTWPRLIVFLGLAAAIVVFDQLTKRWVDASFALSRASTVVAAPLAPPTPVLGDWVRISKGYNDGGIFSLFGSSATFFAIASLVAIAVIVWYELTRGARGSWLLTLALGLLMGGAVGNLLDRVRQGYVVDFVDMGIGAWRWYTFNVADASISVSLAALFLIALFGDRLAAGDVPGQPVSQSQAGPVPSPGDVDGAVPPQGREPDRGGRSA